jgi:hypothetical protein
MVGPELESAEILGNCGQQKFTKFGTHCLIAKGPSFAEDKTLLDE